MKRSRKEEEELPELPTEVWDLIVSEVPSYESSSCVNTTKLKCWMKLSLLNQSFRTRFLQKISTKTGVKELLPDWPGKMPDFNKFSKITCGGTYSCYGGHNALEWLKISTYSTLFHKCSKVKEWIKPIESFKKFVGPMLQTYGIKKSVWGGKISSVCTKIDENWEKMTKLNKTKSLLLLWKLLEQKKKKTPPNVKAPNENTKWGCLFVYREEWREEGERNGRFGEIFSNTGKRLYLGAFKPVMSIPLMKQGDTIYQFQFQQYNGDRLRHHDILREACNRVSKLQAFLDEIEFVFSTPKK